MPKPKLIRITTVPQSLRGLLRGQLRFMSSHFDVIGISSSGEALHDVEKNEGVPVIAIEMTRTISPVKDLKSVWQLYKIFRKEKPLVVHTHTPKAGIVGMLAAKMARVPNRLHTVAGLPLLEAKGNKRKILDAVEKLTYRCATKVYPNSFGLYDIILKNKYTKPEKLKVIGKGSSNGIDTEFFNPQLYTAADNDQLKYSLGILPNDFTYIFVGRMVRDKGINELVSAFKMLNNQHPETKLLLVGSMESDLDPLLPETEKEMAENPAILAVGHQNDVRPYLAVADVLAFPSYREGFPNVVMQAGAMGLPGIVTNINGCNEIIIENENGLIIPVKNTDALFGKMEYLYLDRDQHKRMANNSRNRICNNYERITVWNAILKEYETLPGANKIKNV